MPGRRNPTVRREELGAALRSLRQATGLGIEQVSEELGISPSQISRIENAHRKATIPDVVALCRLYHASATDTDQLVELARGAKEKPWWYEYRGQLNREYERFIGLEDTARSILEYKHEILPGLLQTEDYARAVITGIEQIDPDRVELLVTVRRRRQAILERADPPELDVLLDESVLYRAIGGHGVMRAQLNTLVAQSTLPTIRIRVVPFSAGAHAALGNLFTVLRLPQEAVTDVVYVEGAVQQRFLNRPQDLMRVIAMFESVARVSLSPDESRDLIRRAASRHGMPS